MVREEIDVRFHFYLLTRHVTQAQFTKSCLTAVEEIPLTFEATRDGDGLKDESCYIFADGEVSGQVQFAHAVAHEVRFSFLSKLRGIELMIINFSESESLHLPVSHRWIRTVNSVHGRDRIPVPARQQPTLFG